MEKCVMSFKEFKEVIKEAVASKVTGKVSIQKMQKNNGVVLNGLTILTEETNLSPTIYLENYYEYYKENGLDETVERIIETYERNKATEHIDISFFTDIEKVRSKIKMRLINYEKNKGLLKNVPHIRFLNLAIVFSAIVQVDKKGAASILIHNHHLELWGLDVDELYNIAMDNTKNDYEITAMADVVRDIMDEEFVAERMEEELFPMYILSNHVRLYGATGMIHTEILKKFMEEKQAQKLVIIPSSIQEVLLIPCEENAEMRDFNEMVKEVNATQLMPEEILSDNVYIFDGFNMSCLE